MWLAGRAAVNFVLHVSLLLKGTISEARESGFGYWHEVFRYFCDAARRHCFPNLLRVVLRWRSAPALVRCVQCLP